MKDIERAKGLFASGAYTCVLAKGEETLVSGRGGIAPMMGWLQEGRQIEGFSCADKIVGKAAALLFVLGGIREVYATVMSESAAEVLSHHQIAFSYHGLTKTIVNRTGTGQCPMEETVAGIDNPQQAYLALQNKLRALQAAKP